VKKWLEQLGIKRKLCEKLDQSLKKKQKRKDKKIGKKRKEV